MRGKAAAQNASRRANEAQTRIAELEERLRRQEELHHAEMTSLRNDRDQARNRLVREVQELSREAVTSAEQNAQRTIREVAGGCTSQIATGMAWIAENLLEGRLPSDVAGLAAAFQVEASVVVRAFDPDGWTGRAGRRITSKRMRRIDTVERQKAVRDGEFPLLKVDSRNPTAFELAAWREADATDPGSNCG